MAKKQSATVTIFMKDGRLFVRSEGDVVTVDPSIVPHPGDLDYWWQTIVMVDGKGRPTLLGEQSHHGGVRDDDLTPW